MLRTIERQLGRVRSADKFAPRPIDMDISLYDELIYDHDGMVIPDPDIARFPHVKRPWPDRTGLDCPHQRRTPGNHRRPVGQYLANQVSRRNLVCRRSAFTALPFALSCGDKTLKRR
ncbi:MAG: 2-amino-4-hydroxy-6-hydroxymethyldihydropteridine diphosphokinase [Caldilineaceae bacterium]|nr:2-amino-4-hydroxy-6-hydroxymethyldihydropteridine diphosphokinase [Caldilineaceae bacterium]